MSKGDTPDSIIQELGPLKRDDPIMGLLIAVRDLLHEETKVEWSVFEQVDALTGDLRAFLIARML